MAARRHIPAAVGRRVRAAAGDRCGYCQAAQRYVFATLEIEHITPVADGGTDAEHNLWVACRLCNGHKAGKVTGTDPSSGVLYRLSNPRTERWADHFGWSPDGVRVVGRTPTGRATVAALQLDSDPIALAVRAGWVAAGWHPPPPG